MKKRKRGRPKSAEKFESMKVCARPGQIENYKAAAQADQAATLSEFVRRACDERADRVLKPKPSEEAA